MEHILTIWPSVADLAADLGKPYQTVAAWKRRGSIPARYDLRLIELAAARGKALTLKELAVSRCVAPPQTHIGDGAFQNKQPCGDTVLPGGEQ